MLGTEDAERPGLRYDAERRNEDSLLKSKIINPKS
jgi:hypothetical protein